MLQRPKSGVIAMCMVLFLAAGCARSTTAEDPGSSDNIPNASAPIAFGAFPPLSGPNAASGAADKAALEMAIKEVNAAGGVLGRRVVLTVADGACDPQQAVAAAEDLVRQRVDVSVGADCSTALVPAIPVLRAAGITHIEPSANSTDLLKDGYNGLFLLTGTAADEAANAAPWLPDLGAHRTAVIHDGTSYALTFAESLKKVLAAAERPTPLYMEIIQGAHSQVIAANKVIASHADSVFYTGYYTEAGVLVKDLRAAGFDGPIVLGDGATSLSIVEISGVKALRNVFFVTPPAAATTTSAKSWLARYRSSSDIEPEAFSMQAYMSVMVAADAIKRANSVDREAIRQAVASTNLSGPYGRVKFDDRGVDSGTGFQLLRIKDGQFKRVCPPTC
jgi:branched-chain amino acid transport system substrate-binding protein